MKKSLLGLGFVLFLALGCKEGGSGSSLPPIQTGTGSPPPVVQNTPAPPPKKEAPPAKERISLEGAQGSAETTRNIYVVYDGSGSMGHPFRTQSGTKFRSKIEGANWAVHEFMKSVPEDVNLGLLIFDGRGVREAVPLGPNNRQAFLKAIDGVQVDSGTPLGESIAFALDKLTAQYKKQLGYGEYRVVVVTDGDANGKTPVATAAKYAENLGFPLYTIGLDVQENHELRKYSVKYFAASSAEDLKNGLAASAAETETFDPAEFK